METPVRASMTAVPEGAGSGAPSAFSSPIRSEVLIVEATASGSFGRKNLCGVIPGNTIVVPMLPYLLGAGAEADHVSRVRLRDDANDRDVLAETALW